MINLNISLPDEFFNEEVRCGYTVTTEMKELWAVEIDLLAKLMEVCKKYSLKFFLDGGSLLGTIRHGGFIPWDDDIDIVMMRDEYDKLCKIANDEFDGEYFFQTEYTDPGSCRCHAQLRNSLTTGILKTEKQFNYHFNQGIFIDIFPLDEIPDNKDERERFFNAIHEKKIKLKKSLKFGYRYYVASTVSHKIIKKFICNMGGKRKEIKNYNEFESLISSYSNCGNRSVGKLFFDVVKEKYIWQKEWFDSVEYRLFEGIEVPVPSEYVKILDCFFGEWKIPQKIEATHGGIIVDTNKSYSEYIGG